ncbi:MAG: IS110 family transposase [Anaerolineales bacterium]|nr:IS110 family transposase [Anaerolineales bacterium]
MNPIIGCDAHRRYSLFAILDTSTLSVEQTRVNHQPGAILEFLSGFPEGTPVALETVGNYYWIVDEIEQAGCVPLLAHAAKAKVIMGNINKTDKLDAKGLATLIHLGSLPIVWLPPGEIRDERELHRTRMALSKVRTALKNRIHATLAKYALNSSEHSDIFVGKGRSWLERTVQKLPHETHRCLEQELDLLDATMGQIAALETRIRERIRLTPNMQHLKTLPGVGNILAIVIEREVGTIDRFPTAGHLAAYSGVVPRVHSSGGKTRFGRMRKQANNYLKWAFIEAANVVVAHRHHPAWREKKVTNVYERICRRKGHATAVGAVARHLAESAFWILKKGEDYQDPALRRQGSPKLA